MQHLHTDLGFLDRGDIVEINLDHAANVRLLDDANYRAYERDQAHRAVGGCATRSPVVLAMPQSGHWHIAVDLGGAAGRVGASVQVTRQAS